VSKILHWVEGVCRSGSESTEERTLQDLFRTFLEDQADALAAVQAREQARAEQDADALAKVSDFTAPLDLVDFAFVRTTPNLNKPIGP
jgi:hypothetical protein